MILSPKIIAISQDVDYVDFAWECPTQMFFNYYLFRYQQENRQLVVQISKEITSYRYTIPFQDRGSKIVLGLCVYDNESNDLSCPAIIDVNTYPATPCNLRAIDASENRVELVWDDPDPTRGQFSYSWTTILPSIRMHFKETMTLPNIVDRVLLNTTTNVVWTGSEPRFDLKKDDALFPKTIPLSTTGIACFSIRGDTFFIGDDFSLRLGFSLQKNNKTIVIMRIENQRIEFVDVVPQQASDRCFTSGDEFSIKPIFDLEMIDSQNNKQLLGSLEIQANGTIAYLNRNIFSPLPQDFFSGNGFSINLMSGDIPSISMLLGFTLINPYIRGYKIERSSDGLNYSGVNIATEKRYIDIGNNYIDPQNGEHYYYRVTALSWHNTTSFPTTIRVNVIKRTVTDTLTLLHKTLPNLPPGNYRIKAIGAQQETGESPWIAIKSTSCGTTNSIMPNFKITAIGVNEERSLSIKSKFISIPFRSLPIVENSGLNLTNNDGALLDSDGGKFQTNVPRFRVRAISMNGLESYAMLSQTIVMPST